MKEGKKRSNFSITFISIAVFGLFLIWEPLNGFAMDVEMDDSFAGGDGLSEETAFEIATAGQLAYMANRVNYANAMRVSDHSTITYATAYYILTENIVLNDEVFTFLPESGLIRVTDGTNAAFMGTGIKETDTQSQFYGEASQQGAFYILEDDQYVTGSYTGELYTWDSIGKNNYFFKGNFDGNSKTISGIYINESSGQAEGLFGQAKPNENAGVEIKNVQIRNSLIIGNENVGGLVGTLGYVTIVATPLPTTPPIVATPLPTTPPFVVTPLPTTPVVTTPLPTTPVVTTPIATTPVVATPLPTTPVVTTPIATTPVVATPLPTTPVVTTPIATTPVVTTPIATTPVVATPIATTPQALMLMTRTLQISEPAAVNDSGLAGNLLTIYNCSFDGFVLGDSCVGGIVGADSRDTSVKEITNCYNKGMVFGASTEATGAGGIMGSAGTIPSTYIENCYNAGQVMAGGRNCGAITGLSTAGLQYQRNCYYLEGSAIDGAGVVQSGIGNGASGASLADCNGETNAFSAEGNVILSSDIVIEKENQAPAEYVIRNNDTLVSALNGWKLTQSPEISYSSWMTLEEEREELPLFGNCYSINLFLTNLTAEGNYNATVIQKGSGYTVSLSAVSGYLLPDRITVTMGGQVFSDYVYSNGE